MDERLSSHSVEQGLKGQKKKLDRRSGEIDSRAAALILQDFIEERNLNAELLFADTEECYESDDED